LLATVHENDAFKTMSMRMKWRKLFLRQFPRSPEQAEQDQKNRRPALATPLPMSHSIENETRRVRPTTVELFVNPAALFPELSD
jgi:hypothetical protein